MNYTELPIKMQGIVFRRVNDGVEVLLLKRTVEDGGFWQTLTGTLEMDESIRECLVRELREETGLPDPRQITDEMYRFSWQKQDYMVVELVFGIEVGAEAQVKISQEHDAFAWKSVAEALGILKHKSSQQALMELSKLLGW